MNKVPVVDTPPPSSTPELMVASGDRIQEGAHGAARLTTPFCCYGNDVDCDRCGSWGVFSMAAKMGGPWDEVAG